MALEVFPVGDRCWVQEIVPVDDIQARANAAGLVLVEFENRKPLPTSGYVVAVGDGPFIRDKVKVGDMVMYGKYAGGEVYIEGKKYRSILDNEITAVARGTKEELEALNTPPGPSSPSSSSSS